MIYHIVTCSAYGKGYVIVQAENKIQAFRLAREELKEICPSAHHELCEITIMNSPIIHISFGKALVQ